MKKIILLFILIPCISIAATMKMIGQKGDPAEVIKVIKVKMYDNYYEPNDDDILPLWQLDDGIIEGALLARYPENGNVRIRREAEGKDAWRYTLIFIDESDVDLLE